MSRYGLIICPYCSVPLAADLRRRTMTCVCGRRIELVKVKPRFISSSPSEVADAVAMAKVQTTKGKMIMPSGRGRRSKMGRLASRAKGIKDFQERISYIALELTKLKNEFSLEDLEKLHEMLGKESSNDMLVAMRESGIVYESSKGKYRAV